MKSYLSITGKYLKTQKKRSVLTVVGIILSVALVTGIGTIFSSMYAADMRDTIRQNGDYHAAVAGVTAKTAPLLTENVETEKAGAYQELGFAAFAANNGSQYDPPYKYFSLRAVDAGAAAMLPYELQDGRMPAAPGEIAVDYWALKYIPGGAIGSSITVDMGRRILPDGTEAPSPAISDPNETFQKTGERQFTVVGTLKPRYIANTNFAQALTFLDWKSLPAGEEFTAVLKMKSLTGIQQRVEKIVDAAGLSRTYGDGNRIAYNDQVLRLLAQSINDTFNSSMITIVLIIVGLVVLSTIAVIYNAFNISVVERVSQFGLLRCVGATPAQIRRIVFREALILGLIGIPIGLVCGTVAMDVVFRIIRAVAPDIFFNGTMALTLAVSPALLAASAVIGAATIYLSALLPARKAAKVSPMEAVRGTGSLKKEKYRRTDRHRIVLRLLGAEGWMAWKNLGRNRKRFYITVLSMVISIVLFIVFSSLVGFAFQSGAVDTGDMPSYLLYPKSNGKLDMSDGQINALSAMEGTDYVLALSNEYAEAVVPTEKLDPTAARLLADYGMSREGGDAVLPNSNLLCYKDNELDALLRVLKLNSIDRGAFLNGEGIILVNSAAFNDRQAQKKVLASVTTLKPGDRIGIQTQDLENQSAPPTKKQVDVLAVIEGGTPGYQRNSSGGVFLIVSEKLMHEMAPKAPFPRELMVMMRPGADSTAVKDTLDGFLEAHPDYDLTDLEEAAQSYRQVWVVMSIFLYGFVAVISLIGCLNIINTISTNIILRTRELSMLRAVGMGESGIRRMVALESVLHAAAAALIGSVVGTGLSRLLYGSLSDVRGFPWHLPWMQILIAVGAAALVAVVSGFVPLRRINRAVIIEGIRGEE